MFVRKSYPVVYLSPDAVRRLRAQGLNRSAIARELHISPMKFFQRVAESVELQAALDEGEELSHRRQTVAANKPKTNAEWDDLEFETTVPLTPLDDIILNAVAAGFCDRPAIERLLNPHKSPQIQITPSLERLIQHGKISEIAPSKGVILTKYEIIEPDSAASPRTSASAPSDDEPRRILEDRRQNGETPAHHAGIRLADDLRFDHSPSA